MLLNFEKVDNWSYTQKEDQACKKICSLRDEVQSQLPPQHKSNLILTMFDEIRETRLYKALKTLPKGVIHHVHFDCLEDEDFYAQHVITDPIVYLSSSLDGFHLGTKQEADEQGWVSMSEARKRFGSDQEFVKHVSNFTMMNKQEVEDSLKLDQKTCWDRFEKKISNFFPILGAVHLFRKYSVHILRKLVRNGYSRIQFRSLLTCLNEYSETGEIVQKHDESKFMQVFDEAFELVKSQYQPLSVGFIFFGLKMLSPQDNENLLTGVLEKRWPKTVGIDFVQQQDPFGSQAPYNEVADKVLSKFSDLDIKKVYHVGETKDHLNNNIEIAINAGTARIGHGINLVQHPNLIEVVKQKKICFEKSPISNLLLSYVKDPRVATAQLLLGLGVPVTINPDDPGKFGLEDTTMDYFVTFVSSNWDLKHLKLIAIYSINHAICSEDTRKSTLVEFNRLWEEWITNFLQN